LERNGGLFVVWGFESQQIAAFGSSYRFGVHRPIAVEHNRAQELPKAAIF
jgi:hypothetical protein